MRFLTAILVATIGLLGVSAGIAPAQEKLGPAAPEEAQRVAERLMQLLEDGLDKAPVQVSLTAKNSALLRIDGGGGVLLIADSGLSAETLGKVGKDLVPVGVLLWRKLALVSGDDRVAAEGLFKFTRGDVEVQAVVLAARKTDDGLALQAFGPGDDPVASAAIKAVDGEGARVALSVAEKDEAAKRGVIALHLAKNLAARLKFGAPE